jgi:hypothetical protein
MKNVRNNHKEKEREKRGNINEDTRGKNRGERGMNRKSVKKIKTKERKKQKNKEQKNPREKSSCVLEKALNNFNNSQWLVEEIT